MGDDAPRHDDANDLLPVPAYQRGKLVVGNRGGVDPLDQTAQHSRRSLPLELASLRLGQRGGE